MKQNQLFGKPVKIKEEKMKIPSEKEPLKIQSLTYSKVKDYLKCPRLFYYRHVLKLKMPQKQMELVFGGAIHDAIEGFHNGQDPKRVFIQAFDKAKLLPEEQEDHSDYVEEGMRLMTEYKKSLDYFTNYHKINPEGQSEVKFREWLKDPLTSEILEVPFSGRIDRITNSNQIIEFKTSSKLYKQDDVDTSLQDSFYSLIHLQQKKIIPEFFYIVLVKGRKEPIQVLKTSRTKEQLSYAFKMADLVLKGVRGNQYPVGSGWAHKFCDCQKYEEQLLLK